jgi:hypothetical protein
MSLNKTPATLSKPQLSTLCPVSYMAVFYHCSDKGNRLWIYTSRNSVAFLRRRHAEAQHENQRAAILQLLAQAKAKGAPP